MDKNKWIIYDKDNGFIEEFVSEEKALNRLEELQLDGEITQATVVARVVDTYRVSVKLTKIETH